VPAEIVNLRRVRKAKARDDAAKKADANRRKFGMTAAERKAEAARREKAERALAGHKRERADEDR
jgi:hypothetical protein